ncbi:MAG TPA: hypothetical protein VNI54_10520 [Thermoanaerobaculia bacterium]|nr:hypothetical protein [Thermoanaerobaculia bacterium]
MHGIPRATKDIDIVIAPSRDQLALLVGQFPAAQYHAVLEEALFAFDHQSIFNVTDYDTGWRVDFIIAKNTDFNAAEFHRRREVDVAGTRLYVASPEDVLIAKLDWAKQGASDRQIDDAANIIRAQGDDLDVPYIERWVDALELQAQWRAARGMVV